MTLLLSCKEQPAALPKEEKTVEVQPFNNTLSSPSQGVAHLPRLKGYRNQLYMTWVEQQDSLATLKYAIYENENWGATTTITSGTDWFVNWADFPSLAINGGTILTNVLKKSAEGTYDYDVQLSLLDVLIPTDQAGLSAGQAGARKQKNNLPLHTDGIAAEHGFVSSTAYDGGYYVSWLDGRNTKNKDAKKNQMTLRNAYVDMEGIVSEETEIDPRVCDCCNTQLLLL